VQISLHHTVIVPLMQLSHAAVFAPAEFVLDRVFGGKARVQCAGKTSSRRGGAAGAQRDAGPRRRHERRGGIARAPGAAAGGSSGDARAAAPRSWDRVGGFDPRPAAASQHSCGKVCSQLRQAKSAVLMQ